MADFILTLKSKKEGAFEGFSLSGKNGATDSTTPFTQEWKSMCGVSVQVSFRIYLWESISLKQL